MNAIFPRLCFRIGQVGLALLAGACSRREGPDLLRLIDELREENVVATPLAAHVAGPAGLADIAPLDDLGSGPNPFGLKRRLELGQVDLTALAAVPGTHLRFRLRPPPAAMLSFTYGIRKDEAVFSGRVESRRVAFRIEAEDGAAGKVLFERSLVLDRERPLAFNLRKIDLAAYAGREIVLHLFTEGDPDALAFWFHPVVYPRRSAARNLVLLSLDTLRADHLGCYGYERPTSPAIDALAAEGTLFERAYAPSPWTLPSHMSLMTGLSTRSHGVVDKDLRLDPGVPTLAERLKPRGLFASAVTGGGYVGGAYGFHRGFDSYRVEGEVRDSGSAGAIGRSACRILEDLGDRGFFLFVHTYQIHSPFFPPEDYAAAFAAAGRTPRRLSLDERRFTQEKRYAFLPEDERRDFVALYDAEIRYTDDALVRPVLEKLKALGLYDRTMVVLVGDHGEEFREHGGWGHGHQVYEEVLRVPLIVKPAGRRPRGRRVAEPAGLTDVTPTVLEAFGIPFKDGEFNGRSLLSRTAGGKDRRGGDLPVFADLAGHTIEKNTPGRTAVIRAHYKLILSEAYAPGDLAYFQPAPPRVPSEALFDLAADPGEKTDLSASRPDLTRTLMRLLTDRLRPRKGTEPSRLILDGDLLQSLRSLGYLVP